MSRTSISVAITALTLLCLSTACPDQGGGADDDDDDTVEDYAPVCEAPPVSACGNEASWVQGTVRLSPDLVDAPTTGDIVVVLSHQMLGGGENGGFFHTSVIVEDADLTGDPVPFQLDMCAGGSMWSEENCGYNLLVRLDTNGDHDDGLNQVPDEGEPATRFTDIDVSCSSTAHCLDVVLDCVDGQSCVSFTETGTCFCGEPSCGSEFVTCE